MEKVFKPRPLSLLFFLTLLPSLDMTSNFYYGIPTPVEFDTYLSYQQCSWYSNKKIWDCSVISWPDREDKSAYVSSYYGEDDVDKENIRSLWSVESPSLSYLTYECRLGQSIPVWKWLTRLCIINLVDVSSLQLSTSLKRVDVYTCPLNFRDYSALGSLIARSHNLKWKIKCQKIVSQKDFYDFMIPLKGFCKKNVQIGVIEINNLEDYRNYLRNSAMNDGITTSVEISLINLRDLKLEGCTRLFVKFILDDNHFIGIKINFKKLVPKCKHLEVSHRRSQFPLIWLEIQGIPSSLRSIRLTCDCPDQSCVQLRKVDKLIKKWENQLDVIRIASYDIVEVCKNVDFVNVLDTNNPNEKLYNRVCKALDYLVNGLGDRDNFLSLCNKLYFREALKYNFANPSERYEIKERLIKEIKKN